MSGSHGDRGLRARLLLARAAVIGALLVLPMVARADGPTTDVSENEWAGIQEQIEVERHRIAESDHPGRLYRADNPTQRFTAHFGADDVLLLPAGRGEPAWQLGLRLTAWGSADELQPVPPAGAIAEGNRVEYRRGPLTEWYVNTTMGLEQGFTIDAPPGDDITELVLEMTLDGDLTARLAENGNSVAFRLEGSNTTLTYSGLTAWDVVEEPLEARMELANGGDKLRLVVAINGGAWPITVDPVFTQVAKLLPTKKLDTEDAHFGQSVAIDGDLMVVSLDDRDFGYSSGSAHIFQRNQGGPDAWGQVAKLTALDGAEGDRFGESVAIDGDIAIIGASWEDNNGSDSGSAYVFRRDQGGPDAWGQVAKIAPDDGAEADGFGTSVSISGDTVIVGAYLDDDLGDNSGSAYLFRRDQGGPDAWGQVAKITPDDGEGEDWFGVSVAISGDTAIVGAEHYYYSEYSGSAYIFQRNQGGSDAWGQVTKVIPDVGTEDSRFGISVAISNDTAIIGAFTDEDNGVNSGSASIFERDQGGPDAWGKVAKITPDDIEAGDSFGVSVAISDDTVIVGAWLDDDYGNQSGSAYVFRRNWGGPDAWGQVAKIIPADGAEYDWFGVAVAISGDTAVVGAESDDDVAQNSGAVYIYQQNQGGPDVWGQIVKHPCPPVFGATGDFFGVSVSISGDTAIVGASGDDDNGSASGSAYIFQRDYGEPDDWGRAVKITPDDGAEDDRFGVSVAISGDTVIVGAEKADWGSAFIFQRDQNGVDAWGQVAKITPPDGPHVYYFGHSVAINGDTVIVGAYSDYYNGLYLGSAYIFQRDHGGPDAWGQVAKITSADGAQFHEFGYSVSVGENTAIVGAPGDDGNGRKSGAAYIFQRDQGGPDAWGQVAKITPDDGAGYGEFGYSVSISRDTVVVGAHGDYGNGVYSGSAYLYRRDQGGTDAWGQVAKITPDDGVEREHFGVAVAINDGTVIAGANGDDHPSCKGSGSAYVFRRDQGGTDAWGQLDKIAVMDGSRCDLFGNSVAVDLGALVIGAPGDDDLGGNSGAAYVFYPSAIRRFTSTPRRVVPVPDP